MRTMNLRAAWATEQIQGQLGLHFEFLFPRTNSSGNAAELVERVSTYAQSPGFGPQHRIYQACQSTPGSLAFMRQGC